MYAPDFRPSSASWRTWRASSLAVSLTLAAMIGGVLEVGSELPVVSLLMERMGYRGREGKRRLYTNQGR
jgi:hypothetical protein